MISRRENVEVALVVQSSTTIPEGPTDAFRQKITMFIGGALRKGKEEADCTATLSSLEQMASRGDVVDDLKVGEMRKHDDADLSCK